jgi:LEA14-like dessication related protein
MTRCTSANPVAIVLLAGLGLAPAGCATLQRPIAPEVIATRVSVVEVRLPEVRVAVELTMRNRNVVAVPVARLDVTLALDGVEVGGAKLVDAVTLPAYGEVRVPLDVRADASAALAQVGAALGSAQPLVYDLHGTIRLADGTEFPFRRHGSVPARRRP